MRYLIFLNLLLIINVKGKAQYSEFKQYSNGLIYSDSTISQLKLIVDSLNLKVKVCDQIKVHYSLLNGKGNFIQLEGVDCQNALRDMNEDLSFDAFIHKYKSSEIEKELIVVKYKYRQYNVRDVIEFSNLEFGRMKGHSIIFHEDLEKTNRPFKNKWVYRYTPRNQYSPESISAFYMIEEFTQTKIPENYSRMIQYTDCMVDTSTYVINKNAYDDRFYYNHKMSEFLDYVYLATNKPVFSCKPFTDIDYEDHKKKVSIWDSLKFNTIDSLRKVDLKFDTLLNEAILDIQNNHGSEDEFEEYVAKYLSLELALNLKRQRNVIGRCSQDNSPRKHAFNIAVLAAETINWELFLRAHLNIMNDRFLRITESNIGQVQRETYLRELEILNIDLSSLLFGSILRIENNSTNHYYSSISRVGRALSESSDSELYENLMLQMITDKKLDLINRIQIYYLFLQYNSFLENVERKKINETKLNSSILSFPAYFGIKIDSPKD